VTRSSSYPQLQLDEQLCFPLYAASRAVTRRYADLLAEAGLTYPQYLCLLALWEADRPLSVSDLGHQLLLDSGTLTPLLKRLEGMGHVRRTRDSHDERRVLVDVTDQGWELRDRVADVPLRLAEGLGISEREGRQLRRLLDTVLGSLSAG
jgi:DNA-binding MarR family transcriptional regulator